MKREIIDELYRLQGFAKTLERALKIEKLDTKMNSMGEVVYIIGIDKLRPLIEERLKEILEEIENL